MLLLASAVSVYSSRSDVYSLVCYVFLGGGVRCYSEYGRWVGNVLCKEVRIVALSWISLVYFHTPRSIGLVMVFTSLFLFRFEFHLVTRFV